MKKRKITPRERRILLKSQQGELDAVLIYNALAKAVKNPEDAETFRKLATEEGHHAAVFKSITHQTLRPKKTKAVLLPILYRLIGKKRLYPLIAQGEYNAVKNYKPLARRYKKVESVRQDEKRHGDIVKGLI